MTSLGKHWKYGWEAQLSHPIAGHLGQSLNLPKPQCPALLSGANELAPPCLLQGVMLRGSYGDVGEAVIFNHPAFYF